MYNPCAKISMLIRVVQISLPVKWQKESFEILLSNPNQTFTKNLHINLLRKVFITSPSTSYHLTFLFLTFHVLHMWNESLVRVLSSNTHPGYFTWRLSWQFRIFWTLLIKTKILNNTFCSFIYHITNLSFWFSSIFFCFIRPSNVAQEYKSLFSFCTILL